MKSQSTSSEHHGSWPYRRTFAIAAAGDPHQIWRGTASGDRSDSWNDFQRPRQSTVFNLAAKGTSPGMSSMPDDPPRRGGPDSRDKFQFRGRRSDRIDSKSVRRLIESSGDRAERRLEMECQPERGSQQTTSRTSDRSRTHEGFFGTLRT